MTKYCRSYLVWKLPSVPGHATIRFGDWRKRQPTVLLDSRQWVALGKPDKLVVGVDYDPVPDNK